MQGPREEEGVPVVTCLTTCVIHLEKLASLDTNAFINDLTCFSAQQASPRRIKLDNGTNMVAAHRELRETVKTWITSNRTRNALLQNIEWEFNPPAASHMGGVWKHQIRTVQKVLQAIVGAQVLDDEHLTTLFCAVEIINGRPITPVSNDPTDPEAHTC